MQTEWFIEYNDYITGWFNSQKGSETFLCPAGSAGAQTLSYPMGSRVISLRSRVTVM